MAQDETCSPKYLSLDPLVAHSKCLPSVSPLNVDLEMPYDILIHYMS